MSVPAKSPASSPTTVPTLRAKERLNPPRFTYAPEISVPARRSDQNLFSWLFKTGRAYLKFYKTGISHVRQTSKLAKELRTKVKNKGPGRDPAEILTRAEWQIIQRSRKDTFRLPAMAVLILVLGEWLPLVVLYITPLIPEACRIPQQVRRDLSKREQSRAYRLHRVMRDALVLQRKDKPAVERGTNLPSTAPQSPEDVGPWGRAIKSMKAQDMTLFELMLFSAQHDCHSKIWDLLNMTPPKSLLQRRVRQKMEYLAKDDELIERDGGFAGLEKEEIERACVERGIYVLGKQENELRRALATSWRGLKA